MWWFIGTYLAGAVATFTITILAFLYTTLVGPKKHRRSVLMSLVAALLWPFFALAAGWAGIKLLTEKATKA